MRGLSDLQRRILVHAYRSMIEKDQEIDRSTTTLCIPAPPWLAESLTKALAEVFESRKRHYLNGIATYHWHPWVNFFEEVSHVQRTIAESSPSKTMPTLTRLFETADEHHALIGLQVDGATYHPWPYYGSGPTGWYFKIEIKNKSPGTEHDLAIHLDRKNIWIEELYPINCTMPELLRDLYGFQPTGHIDAIAFSPEAIGKQRYNVAQASLRRACSRLADRELIVIRNNHGGSLSSNMYERTGIGLTELGFGTADELAEKSHEEDIKCLSMKSC